MLLTLVAMTTVQEYLEREWQIISENLPLHVAVFVAFALLLYVFYLHLQDPRRLERAMARKKDRKSVV